LDEWRNEGLGELGRECGTEIPFLIERSKELWQGEGEGKGRQAESLPQHRERRDMKKGINSVKRRGEGGIGRGLNARGGSKNCAPRHKKPKRGLGATWPGALTDCGFGGRKLALEAVNPKLRSHLRPRENSEQTVPKRNGKGGGRRG